MLVSDPKTAPIARLTPLCVGLALAQLAGLGITVGIAHLAGWNADGGFGTVGSAALGMIAVAVGAACGLLVLAAPGARTLPRIGPSVMASSVARMLVALFCILILFFATQNQPRPLFVALLACGILSLIVETVWSLSAVRRAASGTGPAISHTDSQGARSA